MNKKQSVPEGFCTVKETAKRLKIENQYVLGLINIRALSGQQDASQKNRRHLINKKSIDRFQSFLVNTKKKENNDE